MPGDILETLEDEYQRSSSKTPTLKRLGEVIIDPKNPDIVSHIRPDENTAPSDYVETDIEKLIRNEEDVQMVKRDIYGNYA